MTYEWSAPPASLPDPQQVSIGFRKQWGATLDDSHTFGGTLQFSTGGEPGKTPMDVLNAVVAALEADGWELYYGSASQEVTRTLEET